jgi:hypothetical protein
MANKLVLVIGGNFGGLTAALEAKAELGEPLSSHKEFGEMAAVCRWTPATTAC